MHRSKRWFLPLWGLLALTIASVNSGCGAPKGSVKGKVTYKDSPVTDGTITFVPADGGTGGGTGTLRNDGSYNVDKISTGMMKVVITQTKGPKIPPGMAKKMGPPKEGVGKSDGGYFNFDKGDSFKIPEKYQDASKTDLTYEVKSGEQEHNISIK